MSEMKKMQIAYIPVGVATFHLESAQTEFENSIELLNSLTDTLVHPGKILLTIEALEAFLDTIDPDLIILQNTTFANAAYAGEILKRFSCPLLLWTLREPVIDGERLRLNSLTGAFSAANIIRCFREEPFTYVFGSPGEDSVRRRVHACIRAAQMKTELHSLRLAAIGQTPQGFGFGRATDGELLHTFGVTLESVEVRELIDRAKNYSDEECEEYIRKASCSMHGLENTPDRNRKDFARLYKAYESYVRERHIGALASRCWPDFFTEFGTPVCAVLAMLNDMGIAAACEADAFGALSMFLGMKLTKHAVFFGDPASMNEEENTLTFWHCGTAACSLARQDTGARVDVHCNRKIGPTLDFGCAACDRVTIFRIGKKPDGNFRFFLASGEAPDTPKQFNGTSVVVRTDTSAEQLVNESVLAGWEPHFAVIFGDVTEELEILGNMLNIEVCRY